MASINTVSIELQVKGEREATQALKRYSDASDKLTRSVLNAAGKVESTTNAWDKANRLFEKGILNTKGLQAAQTQLARELAIVNGYTKSNGALNTQKALAELRAAQATREAAAAQAAANAERQRAKQSYNNLLASINPTIAAQQRMRQAHEQVRAALAAGIITRQQAAQTLRDYRAAAQASAAASQQQSLRLNQMGVVAQQAGYQIGDFFVQIQSGTNAMVAFGQQATQLVGTFAMFAKTTRAAVIASGIGIFISIATAVGAAIMRMNGQMDTLDTKVQKMTTSFDDLNTSMDRLEDTDLTETFGNLTDEVESITEAMVELNNAAALNNLMATFEKLEGVADAGFFRNLGEGFLNIGRVINPFAQGEGLFGIVTPEQLDREAFEKLGYDMSRAQYLAYLEGLQNLASEGDIEGVTSLIAKFFQDATDGAAEVSMEGISIVQSMEAAALQAAEFAARQNGSAEASRLLREEAEATVEVVKQQLEYQDKIRMTMGEFIAERRAQEKSAADELNSYIQQSADLFIAAQQRIREENGKTLQERIAAEEEYAAKIKMTMGEFIAERRVGEYEKLVENQELLSQGAETFNTIWSGLVEKFKEGTEEYNEIVQSAEQRIAQYEREAQLNNAILQYGKDSAEVEAVRKDQAMAAVDAYIEQNQLSGELANRIREAAESAYDSEIAVDNMNDGLNTAASNASALANEMSRAASEALRFVANLGSGAGLAAAQARVAGLRAELGARQGGAGDVAAAEARARAQAMADPRTQAALQGPVGLRQETLSRIETEVETARLGAIAGQISSQISALGQDTGGTSGGGAGRVQEDYLKKLQEEADQKLRMIGLSEEQQRYQEIVNELQERELEIDDERIKKIIETEEAIKEASEAESRRQNIMRTINSSIETAFMGLIDGSKSVEDAFTGMIRAILEEIAMQAIVKPIASGITGFLSDIIPSANGNAFSGGNVIPFANGGVVGGPTAFPMANGKTGLMGEAGPEAIMPLKRGKGGKLGVVAEGSSQPVVINQSFNFQANGDESVKRIIAQEAPKIASLTQKQVLEARSRGGAFRTTFGA